MNNNPEEIMEITPEDFFKCFFRLLNLKNEEQLSNNELKVLSTLCARKELDECGITKNNLPPVLKKLNEKGYMDGKQLSPMLALYKEKLVGDVGIVFNFKIVEDDSR